MIRMTVFYPRTEDSHFDMEYYTGSHIPLMQEKLGDALHHVEIDKGIGGAMPGDPPAYAVIGHFFFEGREQLRQLGPHARAIMADVPNFTNVEPLTQFSEVIEQ
jgi:uncharacterized protein (TIGR02118 family)